MGQRIPKNGSSSWQASEQATSKGLMRHARIRRLVIHMGLEPMVSDICSSQTIVLANSQVAGASECYTPDGTSVGDKLRVGQNVDIWSLGCVYSEAARWVKSHYRGVVQYRNERKDEISKIAEFQDADCFHDGRKVLMAVKESHRKSTTNLRTEDYITKAVVDRMITNMLEVPPARPTAANLWYISKGIVLEARNQLQPERWSVEEALDWKRERKETGRHRPILNPHLHDRLRKRDHVGHPPTAIFLGHANDCNRYF